MGSGRFDSDSRRGLQTVYGMVADIVPTKVGDVAKGVQEKLHFGQLKNQRKMQTVVYQMTASPPSPKM